MLVTTWRFSENRRRLWYCLVWCLSEQKASDTILRLVSSDTPSIAYVWTVPTIIQGVHFSSVQIHQVLPMYGIYLRSYRVSISPHPCAPQLSPDDPADAVFLCHKDTVFRDRVKGTFCVTHRYQFGHRKCCHQASRVGRSHSWEGLRRQQCRWWPHQAEQLCYLQAAPLVSVRSPRSRIPGEPRFADSWSSWQRAPTGVCAVPSHSAPCNRTLAVSTFTDKLKRCSDMLPDILNRTAVFEGCQASNGFPSGKSRIKRKVSMDRWWNDAERGSRSTGRETCGSATLSTTSLTRSLRGQRTASNCLSDERADIKQTASGYHECLK